MIHIKPTLELPALGEKKSFLCLHLTSEIFITGPVYVWPWMSEAIRIHKELTYLVQSSQTIKRLTLYVISHPPEEYSGGLCLLL